MNNYARIPTSWIRDQKTIPLRAFAWQGKEESKSGYIAALMLYIAMNLMVPDKKGAYVKLTYTELSDITSLSRAKVAEGLRLLEQTGLVKIEKKGRSNIYHIFNRDNQSGWGQLPLSLYDDDQVKPFSQFKLRARAELDGLKLYLLIIAFRSNQINCTRISYEKINEYTGISERHIPAALSLLITLDMIRVDKKLIDGNTEKRMNVYWLVGLSSRHGGNTREEALTHFENDNTSSS